MALNIGDKVVYSGNSPFSHSKKVHEIVDIKTVSKEDLKTRKFSIGVRRVVEKKGSAVLCQTASGQKNNESYLPVRFYKKLQEAKSGRFMRIEDVEEYSVNVRNGRPFFSGHDFVIINDDLYLPVEMIERQLDDQEWRTMQSKVTTLLIGLK